MTPLSRTCRAKSSISSNISPGFSSAAKWPPASCCRNQLRSPVVAAQLRGTATSSFGNTEYPNGFRTCSSGPSWPGRSLSHVCRYGYRHRAIVSVNQYSDTDSRIVLSEGSSSDHARNFSPIQASSASGLVVSARPIVDGRVPCSIA